MVEPSGFHAVPVVLVKREKGRKSEQTAFGHPRRPNPHQRRPLLLCHLSLTRAASPRRSLLKPASKPVVRSPQLDLLHQVHHQLRKELLRRQLGLTLGKETMRPSRVGFSIGTWTSYTSCRLTQCPTVALVSGMAGLPAALDIEKFAMVRAPSSHIIIS